MTTKQAQTRINELLNDIAEAEAIIAHWRQNGAFTAIERVEATLICANRMLTSILRTGVHPLCDWK